MNALRRKFAARHEVKIDPQERLPVELMQIIFRMLDPEDVLRVARVSKSWHHICRGDFKLRATARRQLIIRQSQPTIAHKVKQFLKNKWTQFIHSIYRPPGDRSSYNLVYMNYHN
uniref:F-box domain-containing protein n=1 Tax=Bracon brevicornis TaxID=1563983 RepID=A0A6V7J9K4_9HYME